MDEESPSVRTSIDRWIRQLTVQGERDRSSQERTALLRKVNPPLIERVEVKAKLTPAQQETIDDGVQEIVRSRGYDLAAHLAIDEVLIWKIQQATGQSRHEILETVSLALADHHDEDDEGGPTKPA